MRIVIIRFFGVVILTCTVLHESFLAPKHSEVLFLTELLNFLWFIYLQTSFMVKGAELNLY